MRNQLVAALEKVNLKLAGLKPIGRRQHKIGAGS